MADYKDNVTVTGETFNGTKFKHKLYYQNGASKEDVLSALRVREPGAQRATVKIWQGPTLEALRAKQKATDAALAKGPTVVAPKAKAKASPLPPAPSEPEHKRGLHRLFSR
jgi:hypothetical protein